MTDHGTDPDTLAAHALDALDLAELDALDAELEVDPVDRPAEADALREAAALLGLGVPATVPASLRDRLIAGALDRRASGVAAVDARAMPRVETYRAAVDALERLLRSVAAAEADAPVTAYGSWTVKDLVAHLVAVERYTGSLLGLWEHDGTPALVADHIGMTEPVVGALRPVAWDDVVDEWGRLSSVIAAHLDALDRDALAAVVTYHFVETRIAGLCVLRAFELWTHFEDVCRATGRPLPDPDARFMRTLSRQATSAIPFGLAALGRAANGRTARIVLTGPGGGTFVQPLGLGETAGPEDVTVVADVVSFCRLAAQRLRPDEVGADIEGDAELGREVLAGAAVFAA
jgi:uncharacterized protein (TIGR03083 family)